MALTFENSYHHCGETWTDTWSCACNDRCPVCNAEIEPFHSMILETKVVIIDLPPPRCECEDCKS